jgi:hypothetical protein
MNSKLLLDRAPALWPRLPLGAAEAYPDWADSNVGNRPGHKAYLEFYAEGGSVNGKKLS